MTDGQCEVQKGKVAEWNRERERGQKVLIRSKGKEEYEAFAVTEAYMCYGIAVVYLDNNFEVPLEWVRAMEPCLHCKTVIVEPFPFETDRGEAVCDDCGRERNMH